MLFPRGYIKRGVEQNAKLHYSSPPPPISRVGTARTLPYNFFLHNKTSHTKRTGRHFPPLRPLPSSKEPLRGFAPKNPFGSARKRVAGGVTGASAGLQFCHRQTGTNVIGHKNRDFHDKRVLRSKRADGLNRSYKVESVYRPLQVCETQTCIKNVLGFLGVEPLSSRERERVF